MAIIIKIRKNEMLERLWRKREYSCIVGGNVIWSSHYKKQYGDSSKN